MRSLLWVQLAVVVLYAHGAKLGSNECPFATTRPLAAIRGGAGATNVAATSVLATSVLSQLGFVLEVPSRAFQLRRAQHAVWCRIEL
eukprot:COSAG02_NODE_2265_length_9290_cov_136.371628_1_plen_87_part_00